MFLSDKSTVSSFAAIRPGPITWAVFLATSWTWCIGMFFPVLLIRDFGVWGWIAFAIPNVIGAASVGYFRYRGRDGEDLVEKHRPAMIAFSLVTIAFHIFFAGWFIPRLLGPWGMFFCLALTVLICLRGWTHPIVDLRAAAVVMLISAVMFDLWLINWPQVIAPAPTFALSHHQLTGLLCVIPGMTFGYLLCPHLDLTLHRARKAMSPRLARYSFTVGFGLFFLMLIFFTLIYSTALLHTLEAGVDNVMPPVIFRIIGVHMVVQIALTVGLHVRELQNVRTLGQWRVCVGLMVLVTVLLQLGNAGEPLAPLWGYDAGEVVYRCFIGFYGLVFPTYVYTSMICSRSAGHRPSKSSLLITGFTVLVALPLFVVGFLWHHPIWLLPGMGIVLIVPLLWRFWIGRTAAIADPGARLPTN